VNTKKNKTFLGRPWRDRATVVYKNTWMDDHISTLGWEEWSLNCKKAPYTPCQNVTYAEYHSTGPGSDAMMRLPWTQQLTDKQAMNWNIHSVLGDWNPSLTIGYN